VGYVLAPLRGYPDLWLKAGWQGRGTDENRNKTLPNG
jgi:hypothetical protein